MNKFLLTLCLLTFTFSVNALSVEANILKDKLAVFEQINANFKQTVTSSEGKILNESTGELIISRPGKFHWQVKTPEEEFIISDAKTIWYYSPFIEQVTLINFTDAVTGTPFALLAGADEEQWKNYVVTQNNNQFMVTNPKEVQLTTFIFEFDKTGNVSKFIVLEEQGQHSEFILTHKAPDETLDDTLFNFEIPAGVEVDDQR